MKRFIYFILNKFLNKQLDFRVRLFSVLAMAGIVISLISTISCIINGENLISIIANITTTFIAYGLMHYASRSGQYQRCYMITIIVIFLIFFPLIFFVGGGYRGAMPCFFIFAVVFTAFMLEGKKALGMAAVELLIYTGLCIFAYFYPDTVTVIDTNLYQLIDSIIGFVAVSISIGITMFLHFRMYNDQQRELEKSKEEAIKLSETKSIFLANMSHEIRTPINVILGMNEMVQRESDLEKIANYSQNIQNAGKTLLSIISNILDVSRIESGKLEMTEQSYQTSELIHELSIIGIESAAKKDIEFLVEVDKTLPSKLIGDFIHVKQVAVNFLSNAVKYTKQGSITLYFGQKPTMVPEEIILCISVADTGIGIKKEHLPLLFDTFTRLDLPEHRNIEGTGLGLSIAKELADLMNGQIYVNSEWGGGSTFSVEIPQKIQSTTPFDEQNLLEVKESKRRGGGFFAPHANVLVVDDNSENLQVIKSLLDRTMIHVDTAVNGHECLKAVKETCYHAILMDYMMPGMDGVETYRRLREEIHGFRTPVIALTANVIAGVEQMFLQEGFTSYLTKPILWQELEDTLLACLPEELVTKSHSIPSAYCITSEQTKVAAQELSACGVSLENGLRYLSGDLPQYKKLAEIFVENYEMGRQEAHALFEGKDWLSLKYPIHSLKSKAQAVGASTLAKLAAWVENHCEALDSAYIECAMPLVFLEWARVNEGLATFISEPQSPSAGDFTGQSGESTLLSCIRAYRRKDAETELDRLIAITGDNDSLEELFSIRQAVRDLNFEDAERLLMETRKDGKER